MPRECSSIGLRPLQGGEDVVISADGHVVQMVRTWSSLLVVCREPCPGSASPAAGRVLSMQSVFPSCWSRSASNIWMSLELSYQKVVGGLDRKSFLLPHDCCLHCFKKQVGTFPTLRFSSSRVLEGYHMRSISAPPHLEALLGPSFWLPSSHVLKERVFSEAGGSSWCSGSGCDKKHPGISRVNTRGAAAWGEQGGNPCFGGLSTQGGPVPDAPPVFQATALRCGCNLTSGKSYKLLTLNQRF